MIDTKNISSGYNFLSQKDNHNENEKIINKENNNDDSKRLFPPTRVRSAGDNLPPEANYYQGHYSNN